MTHRMACTRKTGTRIVTAGAFAALVAATALSLHAAEQWGVHEEELHGPAIVWAPGRIPAGRVCAEMIARVKVTNPTRQLAFFVQQALTQGRGGAEILPVLWDDNYFSLLPGESREVTATFAAQDAGKGKATLEVGGWNVETDFDCAALAVSPKEIKAGERFTVTANVANTFLDGSRVAMQLDGKPVAFKWAWARAGRKESLGFPLTLEQSGRHEIAVGGQRISVTVQP